MNIYYILNIIILQISLGPGFPKEKDIILEVEVIDIQSSAETVHSHTITSGKASIISRMAKMGQSILPKIPTSTTTDSEDTEVYSSTSLT